jgi:hypothetical protein
MVARPSFAESRSPSTGPTPWHRHAIRGPLPAPSGRVEDAPKLGSQTDAVIIDRSTGVDSRPCCAVHVYPTPESHADPHDVARILRPASPSNRGVRSRDSAPWFVKRMRRPGFEPDGETRFARLA